MANTNYPSANEPQPRSDRNLGTSRPNNNSKNIAIGVLAAALLGTWGYYLWDKNKNEEKVQGYQTQVVTTTSARDSVQLLYNESLSRLDSITGNNNNLQGQLSENNTEITKLKNEINSILRKRNATAAELSRAKSLIATLNGKIGNLEAEVARLTGENQQLATTNTVLTGEKQTLETNLQVTTTEKEALAQTVDVGSTFSASNIQIRPIQEKRSGKEKETTTAKRVDKLLISFDVENRIAKSGPADIYVIVTQPNGQVVSDVSLGSGTLTTRTDGDKQYTYRSTLEYEQGTRKNVQIPLRQGGFATGDYKIEIYQNGFKIAEGIRSLKKGGIFG